MLGGIIGPIMEEAAVTADVYKRQDPCSLALLCPLFPPARFPVWVSVWVRHYWSYSLVDANVCCSYHLFYPEDGRLEISNNCTEHSIKPIVMARKNWLLANTPSGA